MSGANGQNEEKLGIYISIPFCRSKCTYCNFASGVYPASEHARYVERVLVEMAGAPEFAADHQLHLPKLVDSIYFGGGTPTLLSAEHFYKIFSAIRAQFALTPDCEITIECAPGQLSDETLEALLRCGVNRISLGVQSFNNEEAAQSGRLHTRESALAEIARLQKAGVERLNIDLIAGLAGQTFASWKSSLETLIASGVDHASVYMLEVDEDSRLGRELIAGGARYRAGLVPSEDAIAQMYETAIEKLAGAGIAQYEISNFARPGHESRHNLRYWHREPYLGLGLDAASFLKAEAATELRWNNTDDLKTYLEAPSMPELTSVSQKERVEEQIFLGFRLNAGLNLSCLETELEPLQFQRLKDKVEEYLIEKMLGRFGENIALTLKGRMLSNEIFTELLAAIEPVSVISMD